MDDRRLRDAGHLNFESDGYGYKPSRRWKMLKTIEGIYRDGRVELMDPPP